MAASYDNLYVINYTDLNKGTISIPKNSIKTDKVDVALVGKSLLEYGQVFDENMLHLLENFASLADPSDTSQPDLTQVVPNVLRQPTEGQVWFNKTLGKGNVWNGVNWKGVKYRNELVANSGIIADGQTIPKLVNDSGYEFSYEECAWTVSPVFVDQQVNYIACYTDSNAKVFCQYRPNNSSEIISGLANYMIVGVKGSSNNNTSGGPVITPSASLIPSSTPTRTPTPTPTVSISPTAGVSPTPTPSVTPTVTSTVTITPTITPTLTRTITPTPSVTPSVSPISYSVVNMTAGSSFFTGGEDIGYGNIATGIALGSLAPTTYLGNTIYDIILEIYTSKTFFIILDGTLPDTIFSKITFTDKDGIPRTFNRSDAQIFIYSGYKRWQWPGLSSSLFDVGSTYAISIYY